MSGIILDSELHVIAKYLIKLEDLVQTQYHGVINISLEIENLNDKYNFVEKADFSAFSSDINNMYQFERQRSLKKINQVSYAKFKLDSLTGQTRIQELKNELTHDLNFLRT